MAREFKWKITLLGDFAVGKTSLVRRYVFDEFSDTYLTSIGVKVTGKTLPPDNNGTVASLLLWDIAGGERFDTVTPEYVRGCAGGIIVCDITRQSTIDGIRDHLSLLLENNPDAEYVVAVNKSDLAEEEDSLGAIAKSICGGPYPIPADALYLTSAKDGRHVQSLFAHIAGRLIDRHA